MRRRLLSTSNPRFPAAGSREHEASTRTLLLGSGTRAAPAPSAPPLLRIPRNQPRIRSAAKYRGMCVQFTRMGSELRVVRLGERVPWAKRGLWVGARERGRRGEESRRHGSPALSPRVLRPVGRLEKQQVLFYPNRWAKDLSSSVYMGLLARGPLKFK